MTEEFIRDVRSFLRCLAGECACCMRRGSSACDVCYSRTAGMLLQRMDAAPVVENQDLRCDIVSRMARIAATLKAAKRPLMSQEIDMADYGTRSKKEFTLHAMMRLGKIGRRKIGETGKYEYFLTKKQNGRNKNE